MVPLRIKQTNFIMGGRVYSVHNYTTKHFFGAKITELPSDKNFRF